jgi:hypothetical protein
VAVLARFVTTGVSNGFDRMGKLNGLGLAFALVLVVGLWFAWSPLSRAAWRERASVPAALLLGSLVLFVSAGLQRGVSGGVDQARAQYYTHLFLALVLPATAVAADEVVRRWQLLALPVLALFVVPIPGTIQAFRDREELNNRAEVHDAYRAYLLNVAQLPEAGDLPRSARPVPGLGPWVDLGWLLDGAESGRVPEPDALDTALQGRALVVLGLTRSFGVRESACTPITSRTTLDLQRGQRINVRGGVSVTAIVGRNTESAPTRYTDPGRDVVLDVDAPMRVAMRPLDPARPPELCE